MARLTIRVVFGEAAAVGPGKIALLEAIAESGSISAAGRALKMSYRRAWTLVEELNALFRTPLVRARPGGAQGGGAQVTALGKLVVREYRALEALLREDGQPHVAALEHAVRRARRGSVVISRRT
ncbi:MAG TPA: LysR family transcriptional regulator [Candidatus Sulfotelmatobacter sp.]|nr:LysR family transcriptional regulator [Candidatus Sulfotelmatobacter sp.]